MTLVLGAASLTQAKLKVFGPDELIAQFNGANCKFFSISSPKI